MKREKKDLDNDSCGRKVIYKEIANTQANEKIQADLKRDLEALEKGKSKNFY